MTGILGGRKGQLCLQKKVETAQETIKKNEDEAVIDMFPGGDYLEEIGMIEPIYNIKH